MESDKARIRYYGGIDPAKRKTGLALIAVNGKDVHRYSELAVMSSTLDGIQLLVVLRDTAHTFFTRRLDGQLLNGATIEGPSLYSVNRADDLGKVRGALGIVLADNSITLPYEIPPTSLKKFATGNGQADKSLIIRAAAENGWGHLSEDEADAAWLAEIAWALDEKRKLSRKQIEAIEGIRNMNSKKTHSAQLGRLNI